MKDTKYLEIIKAPVITEKSQIAKSEGKYTFKVDPKATKLEIKAAIEYCHSRGVKVHITLNTLIKDAEIPDAIDCVKTI